MPYIKKEDRVKWESGIKSTSLAMNTYGVTSGDLNYIITRIVHDYIDLKGLSYTYVNEVVGVLESAKAELQRRIIDKYEDEKIYENGDLPLTALLDSERFK